MEKEQFLFLTQHYSSITLEEARELEQLQQQFPYCQVTHILSTYGAQHHGAANFKKLLNLSAVYTTDRAVLKEILTTPAQSRSATGESEGSRTSPIGDNNLRGAELINEVMADLSRLQELKHNFELSVEAYDKVVHPTDQKKKEPEYLNSAELRSVPVAESVQINNAEPTADPIEIPEKEPNGEALLEEIQSKRHIKLENPKHKEQIEIIDQFIKKQPSITKNSLPAIDSPDLAEKSISLTDNIVSETLVEILLRQGKKDKAIEVLKKLIWKFPQKKAIFAAQIDELRK